MSADWLFWGALGGLLKLGQEAKSNIKYDQYHTFVNNRNDYDQIREEFLSGTRQFIDTGNYNGFQKFVVSKSTEIDGVHLSIYKGESRFGEPIFDLTQMYKDGILCDLKGSLFMLKYEYTTGENKRIKPGSFRDKTNALYYATDYGVLKTKDGRSCFVVKEVVDKNGNVIHDGHVVLKGYIDKRLEPAPVIYDLTELHKQGILEDDLRHFRKR